MRKILVVGHKSDMCRQVTAGLTKNTYDVTGTDSGQATIEWMRKNKPDLVLFDFGENDPASAQLLSKIKAKHPAAVLVVTSSSDVKDTVETLELGVYDYMTKPFSADKIVMTINKALAGGSGDAATVAPACNVPVTIPSNGAYNNQYIMGNSKDVVEIGRKIELVAPTNYSVVIYGESGCGKEAIAQQIHDASRRSGKPFVAIDCGTLSKELAASELFGHEKGAFTGALGQKIGCLETANGGTIFLDEICNLSYEIQVSLLRVVQERKIRRVGGTGTIDLDIRIIVASNINLWEAATAGKFREDLYHRLNEFSITLPSLRERKEDIMLFAHHFMKHTNTELGKEVKGFSKEVEHILTSYTWHGNIRELKNVIKSAVLLTDGDLVEPTSLPCQFDNFQMKPAAGQKAKKAQGRAGNVNVSTQISYEMKTKKANSNVACDVLPIWSVQDNYVNVKWQD